jgi:hypothetical protein
MATNNSTIDRIQAVWNLAGGERGIDRWLAGELKLVETRPRVFAVWKRVRLGTYKGPDAYREALKKAGRHVGKWGGIILGKIIYSQEEIDLDLVMLSVADLGFKDSARYADICARAIQLGLELCPAEVGPALRLQYGDQSKGEWLHIAMKAVTIRDGGPVIFRIDHGEDGLWLDASYGYTDYAFNADKCFLFAHRKNKVLVT